MEDRQPLFRPGARVQLRAQRDEVGYVLGQGELDAGDFWYQVGFGRQTRSCREEDLESLEQGEVSLESLALSGRWGRLVAFRRVLAVERIRSDNRSTIFAFRAERIRFAAYQYKPLLKFLDSQDRRLLIADEVGLGKTIEAGLILTELEARRDVARVLVVCPSRLREKWRVELSRKFGQEFEILEARDLQRLAERHREQPDRQLRIRGVISQQSLRRRQMLEEFLAVVPGFDLVIVDEAHHGRNPGTQTSQMIQDLGDVTDAMLLLTATPIHLGSDDLLTLLHALRPGEFRSREAFNEALERSRPLVEASAMVRRRRSEDLPGIAARIRKGCGTGPAGDPLAARLLEDLEADPPREPDGWVELERRVEELHFLAPILTRTRKRDVQEHAAIRRANVIRCTWTEDEYRAYAQFTGGKLGRDGWPTEKLGLGGIQRARQAASSLPAALRWWRDGDRGYHGDEAMDFDLDDDGRGPGAEVGGRVATIPPLVDSKLEKLVELLRRIEAEEPGAKVLVFTFFVGTSRYLEEQLTRAGIRALRIAGDVPSTPTRPESDERGRIVRRFQELDACRVLISTEVGSEGLDFQFCHHVVNYDLPWNPMVVEQRIGRVDRFGQESPYVQVHSFVVAGTVEERILDKLYNRIRIFEESLGALDPILGSVIEELTSAFVSGKLTRAEAEQRMDHAARALERQRKHIEELEGRAGDLLGHEDHVRAEISRVRRLGRFVTNAGIMAVLEGFLERLRTPGRIRGEGEGLWSFPIDQHVLGAVRTDVSSDAEVQLKHRLGTKDRLTFALDGQVAFKHDHVELLNVRHPLVRAASAKLANLLDDPVARTGQAVLRLEADEDPELPTGMLLLVVRLQQVRGIRARQFFDTVAVPVGTAQPIDTESAERLLHLVLDQGQEWFGAAGASAVLEADWRAAASEARRRNRLLSQREGAENEARYLRVRALLDREHAMRMERIEQKIATSEQRGHAERVLRMFRAQRVQAESRHLESVEKLETGRQPGVTMTEPIAACLVRVERRAGE
ncbi:MAG: DEAD/DEAH box helicase family protein [Planctomycetes bacterium]|nr:DEAD/DEAH box helicase family protein [Planctomycetota bacterium]